MAAQDSQRAPRGLWVALIGVAGAAAAFLARSRPVAARQVEAPIEVAPSVPPGPPAPPLQAEVEALESEVAQLERLAAELHQQIQQLSQQVDDQARQIQELSRIVSELETRLGISRQQVAEAAARVETLRQQNAQMQALASELERQLGGENATLQQLSALIAEQQKTIAELQATIARLEQELRATQDLVRQLVGIVETLQQSNRALAEQLAALEQTIRELDARIAELERKVADLKRQLEPVPKTVDTGKIADFGRFSTITQRRTRTFFVPFEQDVKVSYYVHAQMKVGFFVFNYGGAYAEVRDAAQGESRELPAPILGLLGGLIKSQPRRLFRATKGRCSNCAESRTVTLHLPRGIYTIEAGFNPPGAAQIRVDYQSIRFLEQ